MEQKSKLLESILFNHYYYYKFIIISNNNKPLEPYKTPNHIQILIYPTIIFLSSSMAISSSLFTSPNFTFNPTSVSSSQSHSLPISVKFKRSTVTAAYATAERTETVRPYLTGGSSSLYDVLGVRVGADMREIKSAYRKLARVLHPDVGTGDSSADEFMKVHSAYSTLADPEKRAVYDRNLIHRRAGDSFPVGYKSRRWETDQCW
ncbi:chaperone protein dnaJ 20, chloroplastic-like [Bidens hawaiensis]|uniref:chaperone protein dnaJ 20, chloroplastic-like n=1 Tax=Bidens hawaiensis TaxID=980011 RepID=UPI00404A21A5